MPIPKSFRFLIILIPCTLLRFYLGETNFSFLWFLILYFPFINWSTYWSMLAVRSLLNRIQGSEQITVKRTRSFFIWYLNVPGALVIADIIYRGYVFNHG
jgi:hypothetical protein